MNPICFFAVRRLLVLACLLAFLAACGGTQLIEETPPDDLLTADESQDEDGADVQEPSDSEALTDQNGAQAYPQEVAGTIFDLYGAEAENQLSDAYRQAVDTNPGLRYNIVYFDYDRALVRSEGRKLLREHAPYLQANPQVRVSLEGHADERGSADYNIALGERRSKTVRTLLPAYGAPATSLSIISYGEERPALQGHTEQAYSKNRRVEIVYH